MQILRLCLVILTLAPPLAHGETTSEQEEPGWRALPRGRPFGLLPSDPRDLKLGLRSNQFQGGGGHELEADVGGYRSLAGWKRDDGWDTAAGIEGAAFFELRREGNKFPLASSDGLVGIYGEGVRGDWAWQLRFTHISAHIADGLFGVRAPFVYTREFLAPRVAYRFGTARAYLGYRFLTHTAPALPRHGLDVGGYWIGPWAWGLAHPYFGADLKLRHRDEGSTLQLGLGTAFVPASGAPPVRLTVNYLTGHDLRGQFYQEIVRKWSFGLDLDI